MSEWPPFLEPWRSIEGKSEAAGMLQVLRDELGPGHRLAGEDVVAVARGMGDDILFILSGLPDKLAFVHLSFSGREEPDKSVLYYEDWEDFTARRILPDHRALMGW